MTGNRGSVLRPGGAVAGVAIAAAVILGVTAHLRATGFGVAPALATDTLHLRAGLLVFCGLVPLVVSVLWVRLGSDTPTIARLRGHVFRTLALCGVTAVLIVLTNFGLVERWLPEPLAVLPALGAVAIAIHYALIVHPLSGLTGVGLGARLVLNSSYVWLLVVAALQLGWVSSRALGAAPQVLWFAEAATIELALLGFAIPAALGVLQTNLNVVYHARNMHQLVMRSHYITNGLLVLWGLTSMWAMRFPGSYQALLAAVVGVALLIFLVLIAGSSNLLARPRASAGRRPDGEDGSGAIRLAATAMLFTAATGALIAISATTAAATGGQPPQGLLAAEFAAVGLGVVPLAVAGALTTLRRGQPPSGGMAGGIIVGGATTSVVLWAASGLVSAWFSRLACVAEAITAVGIVLLALQMMRTTVSRR